MVFGRTASLFGALALMLALSAPMALAQQTTGKIEGTVTDQAGAPIGNAQVLLVGTSFGALTNAQGYYFLNNVPVGTYTLRAQFIGYAPAEVRGVRVLGGQTITTPVTMQSSAVVLTGVTVTAAANPIVPRDQVATKTIVSGELIDRLPVSDVREIASLTPGVVESGDDRGVSIRGGRPGEANVYIDGAPVRATNSGYARVDIGTNAIEEASVTTGALGVEFSDAQSGVVSYTTRAGTAELAGAFEYESDEPFGNAMSFGFNRFEGSLGGPIPGVSNLRFFVSGVVRGQLTRFGDDAFTNTTNVVTRGHGAAEQPTFVRAGIDTIVTDADGGAIALPRYVQYSGECGNFGSDANDVARAIQANYGFECQGVRRPMDWSSFVNFSGKLSYTYGSGSSVSLTGIGGGDQQRYDPYTDLLTPASHGRDNVGAYRGRHDWSRAAILNLFHQAFRSSERALSVNLNLSWQRDRLIEAPLDPESETESRHPFMGITFKSLEFSGMPNFPFPITEQIVRDLRTNSGTRGVPLLGRSDLEVTPTGRLNPFGLSTAQTWYTGGLAVRAGTQSETRYTGRLVVDWQANRYHRFTLGGDAKKTNLANWFVGDLTNQIFMDAYVVDPIQYGLFAADRLDLGDVVLEAGVRYDYYNSNTLFPKNPGYITSDPRWNPTSSTDEAAYQASLDSVFTPSVGHSALSPRLRVSFPITEQTGFRLSYAHQVQTPDFNTLLTGINNDLSFTNTNDIFGRDLDFGKTILFEFGVRHAFSNDLVLDVAAYNKDKVSDFAARAVTVLNPVTGDSIAVNLLTNRDFGNARGIDTKLDWRVGNNLSTSISYTFQVSKNTGSDPYAYLNTFARQTSALTGERTPPPEAAQRTNDDRTHNLAAAISLNLPGDWKEGTTIGSIFRNFSVFATVRVQSGLPYTLLINQGDGQTAPQLAFGLGGRTADPALNQREMPWTKNVDLRINKGIRVGRLDLTAYADIRNLFNFKNIVGLFAETGDVVNEELRRQTIGVPSEDLSAPTGEYALLWNEAQEAGALGADKSVILSSCPSWGTPVNCVSLRRVEARFGNGDGTYTVDEQARAFNTYYESFAGPWQFYSIPRHIRLGIELSF
jgi:hypothetical protein